MHAYMTGMLTSFTYSSSFIAVFMLFIVIVCIIQIKHHAITNLTTQCSRLIIFFNLVVVNPLIYPLSD